jgi:hypothetical protein
MRRLAILVGLIFAVSLPAAAQSLPKFEVYGGYEYAHFTTSDSSSGSLQGWSVAPAFYPFKYLGAVLDLGGSKSSGYEQSAGSGAISNREVDASSTSWHAFIGPRVRIKYKSLTPFGDVLFGGIYRTELVNSVGYFDTGTGDPVPAGTELSAAQFNFAIRADGGVDIKLFDHVAWRVEAGYVHTDYIITNSAIADPKQSDMVATTGILIRWK